MPPPLYETFPIDGYIDLSGFDSSSQMTVGIKDNLGIGAAVKSTILRWAATNDDRNFYIALEWTDNTYDHDFDLTLGPRIFDGIKLLFDNDGDGMLETDEDERTVIAASVGSQYIDQHVDTEDETDLIGDGFGRLRYDQGTNTYQAEFLIPLNGDVEGEDADLTGSTRYNLVIFDKVDITDSANPSGNVGYVFGAGNDSSAWPNVALTMSEPHAYPELPSALEGLIVFISTHEETNGEIYSFDPLTRQVTRVTNLPDLFKANVSLSHDRTRIAFHGAGDKDDVAAYEIYVIDIDGTNLTQLTSNSLLDGHPGWSPDDSRIVYASFRDADKASIIIMDSNGKEITDLTPSGVNDNDPDFLPDGRIVFKTDRFSASPQVRIAVMNDDGSQVEQISFADGVSDHDPVGNGTHVVYERFLKDTNYALDVEAGFTPWDIIETEIADKDETTLLSDGWLNWLPVYDPSARYICYLKSSGYTAAYLTTRGGENLGRLIPNITRIRYLDWK
jgi:hypothetical protein